MPCFHTDGIHDLLPQVWYVRFQHKATAHGMPPSKDEIIIIQKKKTISYNASLSKHIRAACNYHVSCDCISVEINCCFNLVFPLTNPDKLKRCLQWELYVWATDQAHYVQLHFRVRCFPWRGDRKQNHSYETSSKYTDWDHHSDMTVLQIVSSLLTKTWTGHDGVVLLPSLL